MSRYQLQTALGEAPRLHSGWWLRRRWVGGVLGCGGGGEGGVCLSHPCLKALHLCLIFNYECISVFICEEQHCLVRQKGGGGGVGGGWGGGE